MRPSLARAGNASKLEPKVTRRGPVVIEDRGSADIIVAVDGEPVTTAAEFLGHIENKKPGDVVEVTVMRGERRINVPVTLGGENAPPGRRDVNI